MAEDIDRSPAKSRSARIRGIFLIAGQAPFWMLAFFGISVFSRTGALKAGGASGGMALVVGLAMISFGITAAAMRASAGFLADADDADDLRERGGALLFGAGALVAAGSSLILLSVTGSGRLVAPGIGLAGVFFLNILSSILAAMRWRRLDELDRSVGREAGYLAFCWLSVVGGTWATLAQVGIGAGPAPLDWLTMIFGFNFVAGLIALARRGGFARL